MIVGWLRRIGRWQIARKVLRESFVWVNSQFVFYSLEKWRVHVMSSKVDVYLCATDESQLIMKNFFVITVRRYRISSRIPNLVSHIVKINFRYRRRKIKANEHCQQNQQIELVNYVIDIDFQRQQKS